MTKNKKRKYLSLTFLIIGLLSLAAMVIGKMAYQIQYDWEYIVVPIWITFFYIIYRNFSQAVKEDEKYGPIK